VTRTTFQILSVPRAMLGQPPDPPLLEVWSCPAVR
jgi:hypothetical protein